MPGFGNDGVTSHDGCFELVQCKAPVVTCDAVVTEAWHLLRSAKQMPGFGNDGVTSHDGCFALDQFKAPVVTCDAVVTEAWHLLGRAKRGREAMLGLLHSGSLAITFSLASDGHSALRLMAKYADQPMSVADACLVRMAELDGAATIITLDSDFKVY